MGHFDHSIDSAKQNLRLVVNAMDCDLGVVECLDA